MRCAGRRSRPEDATNLQLRKAYRRLSILAPPLHYRHGGVNLHMAILTPGFRYPLGSTSSPGARSGVRLSRLRVTAGLPQNGLIPIMARQNTVQTCVSVIV